MLQSVSSALSGEEGFLRTKRFSPRPLIHKDDAFMIKRASFYEYPVQSSPDFCESIEAEPRPCDAHQVSALQI
uniref:Uncharacterized protein n=1 Tax=Anguilla anguilla TaxID=7936 RepID=A0A0E9W7J0_ANGAN